MYYNQFEGDFIMGKIEVEKRVRELEALDGITLAIWGMKPGDENERYVVSFDISINTILDLMSFTEYDMESGDFEPNLNDIFILDTFYDCLMNFSNITVEYLAENEINIYVPVGNSFAKLEIRYIEYEEVALTGYERVAKYHGEKPFKVGVFNYDTMEYDNFPQDFVVDDSKFYCYG